MSIILQVSDLVKRFGSLTAVNQVSFKIVEGSCFGLLGPNGAGKTTLIKAALGLVPLASGKVEIYGKSYAEQRHLVGYVPQRESVDWDFPVTVRDVVLMGTYGRLGWFRRPGQAEREIAERCLEQVDIASLANRQIRQLSGGQQQRVAVARAVVGNQSLILADEPTGNLDSVNGQEVMEMLQGLNDEGTTIVMVTHSSAHADYARRTINLFDGHVVTQSLRAA